MKSRADKFDLLDLCSQGELIVGTAAVVVAVWVYTKPIVFSYDSFTYLEHARELQLRKWTDALYPQLPIFPAILWAFRVTDTTHSVFWLIIFQSCLAVASCWLFYVTARLVYPRRAFVLSLVFIASLLPFVQVKHIMTEQAFFFETMLTLYGLVAYLMARTNRETLSAAIALAVGAALMKL